MFATLTVAAFVIAAPVPKDTKPAGPAPRVLELTADSDGKVRVTVTRTENRKVMTSIAKVVNGQTVIERIEREIPTQRAVQVELTEVNDLMIYTANGKEADKAQAFKKLADGGVVIVSSDGQKVDQKYLKLFRDDVLVMVATEMLVTPTTMPRPSPFRGAAAGGIVVGPAVLPAQAIPVQIEVQAVPAPVAPPPPPPAKPPVEKK